MASTDRMKENEAIFREANEEIRERQRALELQDGRMPFLCECSNEACHEILMLTPSEYEGARALQEHFLLMPGHDERGEEVVERHDRYWLVSKEP